MPSAAPRHAYEERLRTHDAVRREAEARVDRISNVRLLVFLAALVLLGFALFSDLSAHVLWLPLAAFCALVVLQGRADSRARRARRAAGLYRDGLARLDGTWAGRGRQGASLAEADHDYAADLDLFGAGSLFERLCVARTHVGERRLADWLLGPAAPDVIRGRQAAVAELSSAVEFREHLAIEEGDVATALERDAASAWGAAPTRLEGGLEPWLHAAVALVSTVLLIGWLAAGWSGLPMVLSMLVQYLLAARRRAVVHEILAEADRPAQDLALIGRLLERVEGTPFTAPHLRARVERLALDGVPPSRRIRRLAGLMDLVDARRNQIFLPISWLLSLGTQLAYRIEAWRRENGAALAGWIDTLAEIEALASLATYAYEHPDDPFPEIVEDTVLYDGRGLAHPLLPADRGVRNDVLLARAGDAPHALLVSGSNMSGKSTLLRTVGVNAVMAYAGAPVRAHSLRLAPLAVGASIRVHDSLQEGASRFYAEIEGLKRIVDLAGGPMPALFLLDEILHGTNSHDRSVGAAAVVRTLVESGSLGLVTTHDLALATMERAADGRIRNVHFEDQVQDGRMAFDYTLRPGVVERSNALALMRMVGLEIDEP